jgi:hypothetical protein
MIKHLNVLFAKVFPKQSSINERYFLLAESWAWRTITFNVLNKANLSFNVVCKNNFFLLSKDMNDL